MEDLNLPEYLKHKTTAFIWKYLLLNKTLQMISQKDERKVWMLSECKEISAKISRIPVYSGNTYI